MKNKYGLFSVRTLRKILCYFCYFGIHDMVKGVAWSANYMRFDVCDCVGCNFSRYVQDEAGWKLIQFQAQVHSQKRKVLIEKFKEKTPESIVAMWHIKTMGIKKIM